LRLMRAFRAARDVAGRAAFLLSFVVLAAPALRAEYVVLRNGLRLRVTGYQLVGDKYRLQVNGGKVEVAAVEVVAIEPEDTFGPPATVQLDPQPLYRDLVEAAAKRYNMDADLITSVIAVESNFDPKAVSRKNAHGLMQLLPETAAQLGVKNIDDPAENIDAGTRYLRGLLQQYKQRSNAGIGRLQRGNRKSPAIRRRSALCRNDFLRAPRQARLREEQIGSVQKNASRKCASHEDTGDEILGRKSRGDESTGSASNHRRAGRFPSSHKSFSIKTKIAAADFAAAAADFAEDSAVDCRNFVRAAGRWADRSVDPIPFLFADLVVPHQFDPWKDPRRIRRGDNSLLSRKR